MATRIKQKPASNREKEITQEEWDALPLGFGVDRLAYTLGCRWRWVSDHAEELGGTKLAGRWYFSKKRVGVLLGIIDGE